MAILHVRSFLSVLFLFSLALFLFATLSATSPTPLNTPDPYRLDGSVKPYQYYIRIEPNLETGIFHGQVTILVRAEVVTDVITLHSEGNTFQSIFVKPTGNSSDDDEMFKENEIDIEHEYLILKLSRNLEPDNHDGYTISLTYDGTFREDMYGFYISTYHDAGGEERLLAYAIDGVHVRKQSVASVFSYVYSTPSGAQVALEFLRDNFDKAQKYLYINTNDNINSVISGIASRFTTTAQMDVLTDFVTEFSAQLGSAGTSALNTVQNNIDWVESNQNDVFSALEQIEDLSART